MHSLGLVALCAIIMPWSDLIVDELIHAVFVSQPSVRRNRAGVLCYSRNAHVHSHDGGKDDEFEIQEPR